MIEIRKILVPTDFSGPAECAMQYACSLAEKFAAEITILHVVKESIPYHGYEWEADASLKDQLQRLPGTQYADCLQVRRTVRFGPPYLEIITEAQEQRSDMIVIGTHGHGRLRQMMLGSVAEHVVRCATCPVLTIRPAGVSFAPQD